MMTPGKSAELCRVLPAFDFVAIMCIRIVKYATSQLLRGIASIFSKGTMNELVFLNLYTVYIYLIYSDDLYITFK